MLTIVPGFLLRPRDYSPLTAHLGASHVVDIWPSTARGVWKIGSVGTSSYETWMMHAARSCEAALEECESKTLLCHAAGVEVVKRMSVEPLVVVAIGCPPIPCAHHVLGEDDIYCGNLARADTVRVKGGHFNCVSRAGMLRSNEMRRSLGLPVETEEHVSAGAEIANYIKSVTQLATTPPPPAQ